VDRITHERDGALAPYPWHFVAVMRKETDICVFDDVEDMANRFCPLSELLS
jgi:hypothetical protein